MLINPPITFAVTVIIIRPVNFVETIIIVIASCLQNVSYSNDYLLLQPFFLKYSEASIGGEGRSNDTRKYIHNTKNNRFISET